jgi:hypothetical protein
MNPIAGKWRSTRIAASLLLGASLLAGLPSLQWPSLSAQTYDQSRQQGRVTKPQLTGSHLHVVLRVMQDVAVDVVRATEVPGEAVMSDAPAGDVVYEVTSHRHTLAVEAISDPFETRSFPPPKGSSIQGHHIERAQAATIIIKVPQMSLDNPDLDQLAVRLYRIRPEVPLEKIDLAALEGLKQDLQVESLVGSPCGILGFLIRQKGRKAVLP